MCSSTHVRSTHPTALLPLELHPSLIPLTAEQQPLNLWPHVRECVSKKGLPCCAQSIVRKRTRGLLQRPSARRTPVDRLSRRDGLSTLRASVGRSEAFSLFSPLRRSDRPPPDAVVFRRPKGGGDTSYARTLRRGRLAEDGRQLRGLPLPLNVSPLERENSGSSFFSVRDR